MADHRQLMAFEMPLNSSNKNVQVSVISLSRKFLPLSVKTGNKSSNISSNRFSIIIKTMEIRATASITIPLFITTNNSNKYSHSKVSNNSFTRLLLHRIEQQLIQVKQLNGDSVTQWSKKASFDHIHELLEN